MEIKSRSLNKQEGIFPGINVAEDTRVVLCDFIEARNDNTRGE